MSAIEIVKLVFRAILVVWFFGCVCSYKIGKKYLVEGMGIKSAEFFMLCLFSGGLAFTYIFDSFGKWILFGVLILWFVVQFFCHWYYTIFGASQKKIDGYNECFKNTYRIFPMSDKRLVPDLYHIILHILILTNIVLCLF